MKKKTLLTTLLTIAMCLCLSVGATFALFTDEAKVNVAVTSGTVDVNATAIATQTGSDLGTANANFSVSEDGNCGFILEGMAIGDWAEFEIKVENDSDIDVKWQIETLLNGELAPALNVEIKDSNSNVIANNSATKWIYRTVGEGVDVDTYTIHVGLPTTGTDAGDNVYMGKTANLLFTVKAVQGNATTYDPVNSKAEFAGALASGGNVEIKEDYVLNESLPNGGLKEDVAISLNGNTLEATTSYKVSGDFSVVNGTYEMNKTYGHADVRNDKAGAENANTVVYDDVDFVSTYKNRTNGTCTDRLVTALEVCPSIDGAYTNVIFKNCTFDNASVLFEGMSDKTLYVNATFENCTFNALTSGGPIEVANYVHAEITIKNCTFNIQATSNSACAVEVSPNTNTSAKLTLIDNTINVSVATAKTYDPSVGETEVDTIKVFPGTKQENVKFASVYGNTTVVEQSGNKKVVNGVIEDITI